MSAIDHLLRLAAAYQAHEAVSSITLSWRVFGDSKKLDGLAGGKDIQVRRYEKAMEWFGENWPDDLPWPEGVPRTTHPKPAEPVTPEEARV